MIGLIHAVLPLRMIDSEAKHIDEQNSAQPRSRFGERWIVQCPGFRCLAILDEDGKWWDAVNDREMSYVIAAIQRLLN